MRLSAVIALIIALALPATADAAKRKVPQGWLGVVRADRIVFTVVALVVVSVLAALWPALRAARLRPVEAMRAD